MKTILVFEESDDWLTETSIRYYLRQADIAVKHNGRILRNPPGVDVPALVRDLNVALILNNPKETP